MVRPAVDLLAFPSLLGSQGYVVVGGKTRPVFGFVNVVNQKPASSDEFIPAALLPAFEQPVFSRNIGGIPQVAAVDGDRFEIDAAPLEGVAYAESELVVLRSAEARRRA